MLVLIANLLLLLAFPNFAVASKPGNGSLGTFGWDTTRRVFAFGDSYSSVGWKPPMGALLPYTLESWTNGPCWVHYLTTTFNDTVILSFRDFATAGATIEADLEADMPLTEQISTFSELFVPPPANLRWSSANTLFVSWIGTNDVSKTAHLQNQVSIHQKQMKTWRGKQDELYAGGARHFLFLNVPPVHRTPGYSAIPPAAELIHSAVKQYNSQLYWNAVQFQRAHPDASVLFFDAYTTLNQIMDQAGENGFKNATRHCLGYHHYFSTPTSFAAECVNPVSEYVWIDHFHLTTAIHFIFAAEVKKFLDNPVSVFSLKKSVIAPPAPFKPKYTKKPPTFQYQSWFAFSKRSLPFQKRHVKK